MLPAMTIPGAAAGLLLAAGLALGVLLALLVPPARARHGSRPATPPSPALPDDDLPGFLAAPPGSEGRRAVPRSGWAVLSPSPEPPPAPTTPPPLRARPLALSAGLAALVLLAASVAVIATAGTRRPAPAEHDAARNAAPLPLPAVPTAPRPGSPGAGALAAADLPAARSGVRADLTFSGIVLERRAIGVTAAYPHVRVSDEAGAALAHVELVTFNCLADAAPPDPVAAGCSRVVPEYAELTSPALQVTRSGAGGLALRGRFPTYVRPNGTPAAWTGEVYELRIEVSPRTTARPGTDVPATGLLQLGSDRAPATALSVLRPEH
jgi:hypothetical protein